VGGGAQGRLLNALPTAAASERNKGPILEVLGEVLPARGRVLEIASGTGQHVVHFAAALPALTWQPSDADAAMLEVIRARTAASGLGNVAPPLLLDVHAEPWPVAGPFTAIVCINMIHIAPESATRALLAGAARLLGATPPGVLYLYGPFREGGRHTAPSNAEFDAALQARNPAWGVRDLEEVTRLAEDAGFVRTRLVRMPANNLSVVYARR
jgi:SAM-dependent methyltransferase